MLIYINKTIKEFMKDEKGTIFVWFLIFVIPLLYIATFTIDTRNMLSISKSVENSLQRAVLAAAEADPDMLAAGIPQIDPVLAETTFKDMLSENLELNPLTLEPLPGSYLQEPPLINVFTYNGPFPFTYTDPLTGNTVTITEPSVAAGFVVRYDHLVRTKTNNIVRFDVAKLHQK